ncbi:GNAT family N-acetyltransferase [Paenibacillus sp. PR3]|uniref:GNAT family N-acetyltransferase n=1 Tax=Paenibacillus terricola TaxID=2763503 RepID=A0ABR8N1V5_9BACL|nr:GNAT family N-acetyltransferase [Paenibacillus terricola]MBD3922163.1 GNAT family N-acetyltransferase [Paenibacillus terricola]
MTNIEFRKITWDNFIQCIELQVTDEQRQFISSNQHALAEAYVAQDEGQVIIAFAIYKEETLVGFISMYYDDGSGNFEYSSYGIFKMMIDKRYQGLGYGREAVAKAIEYFRTFPRGAAKVAELTYKPDNIAAKRIYDSLGFVQTGKMLECGEVHAELVL